MTHWKYFLEILLFLLLTAGGFFACSLVCNWSTARHIFTINEVESNLFFIRENERFDLTILGISHARNFSRQVNHEITEAVLEKKILNLGRGNALCGMEGQQLYLDFFYKKGNQTKQVLFVASPPLMYGAWLDNVDIAFWDEPIRADFVSFYLKNAGQGSFRKMFYHFRNKLRPSWLRLETYPNKPMTARLSKIDSTKIEEGFGLAYRGGMTSELLERNLFYFEKIATACKKHKSKLTVIIPPAVFGKWEGHDRLWTALSALQKTYGFQLHDFSESVSELKYYRDHHHLNTSGIRYFLEEKLKPGLK